MSGSYSLKKEEKREEKRERRKERRERERERRKEKREKREEREKRERREREREKRERERAERSARGVGRERERERVSGVMVGMFKARTRFGASVGTAAPGLRPLTRQLRRGEGREGSFVATRAEVNVREISVNSKSKSGKEGKDDNEGDGLRPASPIGEGEDLIYVGKPKGAKEVNDKTKYIKDDERLYPGREDVGPLLGAVGGFAGGEKGLKNFASTGDIGMSDTKIKGKLLFCRQACCTHLLVSLSLSRLSFSLFSRFITKQLSLCVCFFFFLFIRRDQEDGWSEAKARRELQECGTNLQRVGLDLRRQAQRGEGSERQDEIHQGRCEALSRKRRFGFLYRCHWWLCGRRGWTEAVCSGRKGGGY